MNFAESIGEVGEERFCPEKPSVLQPESGGQNSLHLGSCFGVRFLLRRGSRRALGNGHSFLCWGRCFGLQCFGVLYGVFLV